MLNSYKEFYMPFITLADAAEIIEASEGRASLFPGGLSYYQNGQQYNSQTHAALCHAACHARLPAYNPLTGDRIIPAETDRRIWSTAADLNLWLESQQKTCRFQQSNANQTANPTLKQDTGNWQHDPRLTKLEKQHKAILAVIALNHLDPLAIPDGAKQNTIRPACESAYPLLFDGSSSFDNAWRQGRELFKMANHASFAKRGNN